MGGKRLDDLLTYLAGNDQSRIALVGAGIISVLIGVFALLAGAIVLAVFVVGAGAAMICVGRAASRKKRQVATARVEDVIRLHLKKMGPSHFRVQEIIQQLRIPRNVAKDACVSIYGKYVGQFLQDMHLTSSEKKALGVLREALALSSVEAEEVERWCKSGLYRRELDKRMADGDITQAEATELKDIRNALGLTDADAFQATKDNLEDAYRALFRRFVADGRLTAEEVAQLRQFADATGISPQEAARVSRADALTLYRRTVAMVCQDGVVTNAELGVLDALERVLGLSGEQVSPLREQVLRVRELGEIRGGKLPVVQTQDVMLRSTEVCHWQSPCTYQYPTKRQAKEFVGNLLVTDRRVIFVSPQRSIQFSPKKIVNITTWPNAVDLLLTSTQGQGVYFVNDAEKLAAVLEALVLRHNFAKAEGLDAQRNRHIPDHVKVAVWQRDGGKCVRCGATDYLEFDHIIPFSKGGANTENNVQLLCRRCNLKKGDELV